MFLNSYHVNVPYKVYWNISSICDTFAIKINNPECSTEERKKLETEKKKKKVHLLRAEAFRKKKKVFRRQARAGSDSVTLMFTYERDGRKDTNEVTSMLLTYTNNNNEPLDNLVLISDSCCGRNKNQTMVDILFTLVHCFHVFKTVKYLFPDFSLIDKKKRHIKSAELPEEWDSIIQEARKKPPPLSVINMHYHDFVNSCYG
ncbi:hypothetical protein PR048_018941 [Dryococelus australis]|uniref:Uncharacterized protein n=1 Tax=Dryococelus australis TaxID=614101 RepID=A0ABQ9H279_9NEOP|nr:hypothetical protein PR048_018941 [Dryococelus australis]